VCVYGVCVCVYRVCVCVCVACVCLPLIQCEDIYERAIPSRIKPELLQSLFSKGGLTNERKMEPDAFLKESALPYL